MLLRADGSDTSRSSGSYREQTYSPRASDSRYAPTSSPSSGYRSGSGPVTASNTASASDPLSAIRSISTPSSYSQRLSSSYEPRGAVPSPLRLGRGARDGPTSSQSRPTATTAPSGPTSGLASHSKSESESDADTDSIRRKWDEFAQSGINTGLTLDLDLAKPDSTSISPSPSASPTDGPRTSSIFDSGDVLPGTGASHTGTDPASGTGTDMGTGTGSATTARSFTDFSRPFRSPGPISAHTPASGFTGTDTTGTGVDIGTSTSGSGGGGAHRVSVFDVSSSSSSSPSRKSFMSGLSERILRAKRNHLRLTSETYSRFSSYRHRQQREARESTRSSALTSPASTEVGTGTDASAGISESTIGTGRSNEASHSLLASVRSHFRSFRAGSRYGSSAAQGSHSGSENDDGADLSSDTSNGEGGAGRGTRTGLYLSSRATTAFTKLRARARARLDTGTGTGTRSGAASRMDIRGPTSAELSR